MSILISFVFFIAGVFCTILGVVGAIQGFDTSDGQSRHRWPAIVFVMVAIICMWIHQSRRDID